MTLYSLKIADKDGVTLFQDDFSKILTNSYVRTDANGADTIADPLADNIEKGNVILRIKTYPSRSLCSTMRLSSAKGISTNRST